MNKLVFGLLNNKLVSINEAEQGLKCGCVCPYCKSPLIAKKGIVNEPHFAHKNAECEHGVETSLHLFAKMVLLEEKKIFLPEVSMQYGIHFPMVLHKATFLEFDEVRLENKVDSIIPDVILCKNGRQLAVEIYVTNPVDDVKLNKIKRLNLSTLEIDLSKYDFSEFKREEIKKAIIYGKRNKKWIFNSRLNKAKQNILSKALKKDLYYDSLAPYVADCPIKRASCGKNAYADFTTDCCSCSHRLTSINNKGKTSPFIYCLGDYFLSRGKINLSSL